MSLKNSLSTFRYFYVSVSVSLLCLSGVFIMTDSWAMVYSALVLSVLEISFSFDNAVINAKILNHMDKIWRKRFLLWGILIAVFGMRFVFPILLVTLTTKMGLVDVFHLAFNNPHRYSELLHAGYPLISSFGAGFLFGVFFEFFFSKTKTVFWVDFLENNRIVRTLSAFYLSPLIFSIVLGIPFLYALHSLACVMVFVLGVSCQFLLLLVNKIFSGKLKSNEIIKYGFIGFMYLEVLDASFSFDGVIGAFAITTNILIIMVGLGIGAFFVRSLTIYFVEKRVLQSYVYLEHGAHYAILFLALCLLMKNFTPISEVIVAGVSIGLIVLAWLNSVYYVKHK